MKFRDEMESERERALIENIDQGPGAGAKTGHAEHVAYENRHLSRISMQDNLALGHSILIRNTKSSA